MPLKEDYLSLTDTAYLLGVSKRTLARWHTIRKGPARIAVGRKVIYRIDAILDWLKANETRPQGTFSGGPNGHA
ncbi:helix-turn-helix domain-containing protein [uncultured Marivita sp.]|uniref:helix-turn-helix transcriptional regulator n=1 Tax=uncultured Marivita sp. TaxID=888080 RepID=UPI0026137997|nr:helix-turn-helix domain-containing protein [uncultured Marivita sp.]